MKDRFSGYRDAMDRSVFKGKKFTSSHKREVFAEIKKSRKKSGDWFPRTMSVAFGILILLIGGYFLFEEISGPANQAESPPQSEPASNGSEITPTPIDEESENKDDEIAATDEEWIQEYPYKEIKEHFDSYELPEEGRVEGGYTNRVTYENGYTFDSKTKSMMSRKHSDEGPAEPTEGQKIGVIMGFLSDASGIPEPENRTISNASDQMYHPLSRFEEIKHLNDFAPLEEWLAETEEILKKFENSQTTEENKKYYLESYEKLQKMNTLIKGE
ncbi:hypothetical protein [Metaplanococcus flavidus]|uniref:Uncharacterized protein n=1 Tax=Metaplanococcus flavidus TaxID=569883 RepID=A0ABW3LAC4_9BACL